VLTPRTERPTIGWREWVSLPALDVDWIKAKVDTGARTSSLHAFDIERFRSRGQDMVRFLVHPDQRSVERTVYAEARLLEMREVRNSGGLLESRPVILTTVGILGEVVEVELTLTRRDMMGFRMLLGRQAVRNRFLVDPGRSYYSERPRRAKKKAKSRKQRREP
jgi:hypothetical protein